MKKRQYYKGKYFMVFYDKDDTELLYMFDNVRDILHFQNKEITRQNVNLLNVELYRALKSKTHQIRFLTGEIMKVYIFDIEEEEE
jgi:hypothetical protein